MASSEESEALTKTDISTLGQFKIPSNTIYLLRFPTHMARTVGICLSTFRKTPLKIQFVLYHRGAIGFKRQLPPSVRQGSR